MKRTEKTTVIIYSMLLIFTAAVSIWSAGLSEAATINYYYYDLNNRLIKVDLGNGMTEEYTYDAAGNRTRVYSCAAKAARNPALSPGLYDKLQDAFNGVTANGQTIRARNVVFSENLTLDQPGKTLSVRGGFECTFTTNSTFSTVQGYLVLLSGTAILENLIIQ